MKKWILSFNIFDSKNKYTEKKNLIKMDFTM
jgi:hypothetical protein